MVSYLVDMLLRHPKKASIVRKHEQYQLQSLWITCGYPVDNLLTTLKNANGRGLCVIQDGQTMLDFGDPELDARKRRSAMKKSFPDLV